MQCRHPSKFGIQAKTLRIAFKNYAKNELDGWLVVFIDHIKNHGAIPAQKQVFYAGARKTVFHMHEEKTGNIKMAVNDGRFQGTFELVTI
jgi:hypothetical protein